MIKNYKQFNGLKYNNNNTNPFSSTSAVSLAFVARATP